METPCHTLDAWLDQNPAVWPALGAIGGILASLGNVILVFSVIIPAFLVLLYLRRRAAMWFAVGVFAAAISAQIQSPRELPERYWYYENTYSGEVEEIRRNELSQRAIVLISDSAGPFRCEVVTSGTTPRLECGDIIRFNTVLCPPEVMHPLSMASLSNSSAGATIFNSSYSIVGHHWRLRYVPKALADRFRTAINATDISDCSAALLNASIFGQSAMPLSSDAFKGAGLAHLLCVSGFHVALLLSLLTTLLLPLRLWPHLYRYRLFILLPCLWIFVLMTGANAPAMRAGIMLTLLLIAGFSERNPLSLNSLCAAIFLILLIEPASLFSAALWLSVSAVIGLIMLSNKLNPYSPRKNFRYSLFKYPATCVAAAIATLPVIVLVFNSVPVMSVAAGVLAIPVFPLFVVSGLLAAVCTSLGIHFGLLCRITDALATYLNTVAEFFANLPFSSVNLNPTVPAMLILCCGVAVIVLVVPHLRRRYTLIASAVGVLMICGAFSFPETSGLSETVFTGRHVIVNHGSSAVLYTNSSEEPSPASIHARYFNRCGISSDSIVIVRRPDILRTTVGNFAVIRNRTELIPGSTRKVYIATNSISTISNILEQPLDTVLIAPSVKPAQRRTIVSHCRLNGIAYHDLYLGKLIIPSEATAR